MCGCLSCAPLGTWPATQSCALTGNQTSDHLVCTLVLTPLSHTSQEHSNILIMISIKYSVQNKLQFTKCLYITYGGDCNLSNVLLLFLKDFIYLFLEREGEKHQCVVASPAPSTGATPATQPCALTGTPTGDPLVCSPRSIH